MGPTEGASQNSGQWERQRIQSGKKGKGVTIPGILFPR